MLLCRACPAFAHFLLCPLCFLCVLSLVCFLSCPVVVLSLLVCVSFQVVIQVPVWAPPVWQQVPVWAPPVWQQVPVWATPVRYRLCGGLVASPVWQISPVWHRLCGKLFCVSRALRELTSFIAVSREANKRLIIRAHD